MKTLYKVSWTAHYENTTYEFNDKIVAADSFDGVEKALTEHFKANTPKGATKFRKIEVTSQEPIGKLYL